MAEREERVWDRSQEGLRSSDLALQRKSNILLPWSAAGSCICLSPSSCSWSSRQTVTLSASGK